MKNMKWKELRENIITKLKNEFDETKGELWIPNKINIVNHDKSLKKYYGQLEKICKQEEEVEYTLTPEQEEQIYRIIENGRVIFKLKNRSIILNCTGSLDRITGILYAAHGGAALDIQNGLWLNSKDAHFKDYLEDRRLNTDPTIEVNSSKIKRLFKDESKLHTHAIITL